MKIYWIRILFIAVFQLLVCIALNDWKLVFFIVPFNIILLFGALSHKIKISFSDKRPISFYSTMNQLISFPKIKSVAIDKKRENIKLIGRFTFFEQTKEVQVERLSVMFNQLNQLVFFVDNMLWAYTEDVNLITYVKENLPLASKST